MAAVPVVVATAVVAAGAATKPIAYQRRGAMDGTVRPVHLLSSHRLLGDD